VFESVRHYLFDELFLEKLLVAAKYPFILTAISMPLAVITGLFLALMRMSRLGFLSWPAATYIEVVRGTPLLVQMYLVYYSLPGIGIVLDPLPAAILCLAGNYAAYEAEIHRAGLMAIDRGQREAALSIGMSEAQAFFRVVLPQAFRIVIPPFINDMISMLKDSCIASVINVPDLLYKAQAIARTKQSMTADLYFAAAVIYMILSLMCYFIGKFIEKKMRSAGAPELQLDGAHH
jgi:His/Glu/Gln/Arg/opine family amino acid ABC transporter permease subunit